MLITDYRLNGTDKAHLVTCLLENTLYHVCNRGLALGSGNTDCLKLKCGIAVNIGCNKSHGIAGILNTNYRNIRFLRYVNFPAYDNSCSLSLHSVPNCRMSVKVGSNNTYEETALGELSVIIDHLCYLSVFCTSNYFNYYTV